MLKNKIMKLNQLLILNIFTVTLFISVPSAILAQSTANTEMNNETRDKINQLNNLLTNAMKKGDLNQIMELYTDDAVMMLPGGKSLKGKKEISEYMTGLKNIKNVKFDVAEAGAGGKIMYQVGKATYITNIDGKEIEQTTDFVMVLKRQPDWDYKISVNSSN